MDKEKLKAIKKKAAIIILYFIVACIYAQYPLINIIDLIYLLMLITYIAILLFVVPWDKLEENKDATK